MHGRERAQDALRSSGDTYERQYAALVALTRGGILQTADENAALRAITESTAHALDVERVSVWRLTPERDAIVARDLFELTPARHSAGQLLAAASYPSYFRALADGDVLVADDAERDERTCEFAASYLRPHGITSMLDAPILVGGTLFGVVCLEHVGAPRTWTAGERSFAISVANLVALVLAQQDLSQSRSWLRTIFESEPECVSIVSPDGRLLDINPAGLRMLEAVEPAAVIGQRAEPFAHPADRAAYVDLHRRACAGETGRLQFRIIGLAGTDRWVEMHSAPLRSRSGELAAVLSVTRDITDQRRAAEALTASERLTSLVLRSAGEGIHGLATDGRVLFCNPAAEAMLGFDERELIGRSAHELTHHHRADGSAYPVEQCPIHQTLRDGVVRRVADEVFFRKDGTSFAVEYVASPMTDEAGALTGAVISFRDVTDRLRTEAALRESQRRQRALMDHLPGMAYRCRSDARWPMEFASRGAAELTGYDPAELLIGGSRSYGEIIHAEDRDFVWNHVQQAARERRPFELEYRITTAAGTEKWVWERGEAVYDTDGQPLSLEGFVADVTQRRQSEDALRMSEQRFRLLARATSDAIWDWDVTSGRLWWSEGAGALLGFPRGEPPPTLDGWADRIHRDDRERVLASLNRALELDSETWSDEYRLQRDDGTWASVLDRGHVIRDAQGRAVRMIGGISDLTERKQLETQLLHSQKLESVGRLAGGVAHDFNNLLTVILGTIDLNLKPLDDADPLHADLREVRRAAERAAGLTQQLLAFSRRQVLQPRVLDLNATIAATLSLLRRLIGEDIDIRFTPAADLWSVRADPGQLEQVLVNLAANARDAMPTGGRLSIQTRNIVVDDAFALLQPAQRRGPHVLLVISDTGVGMDAATRAHAFEPFFTTKDVGQGTGLGLATVYGIVQQSGGSIWVDSDVGRGTTFHILLPRASEALSTEPPGPSASLDRGSETILLVEDEPAVRRLAERVLVAAGYTVLAAASAADALALLDRHASPVHLLLTDVVMPQVNGPALARHIVEDAPDTRVLFMSGYTDDAVVRHGVPAGQTRFLEKPFTAAELTRAVRQALAGGRGEPAT